MTMLGTSRLKRPASIVLACYWIALAIGTHIPLPPEAARRLGDSDKLLHLSAYAGLAFLLMFNFAVRGVTGWRAGLASWGLAAAFGVVDELTQIPVGRQCDVFDWVADITGAAAGIVIFLIADRVVRRASGSAPS